MLMIFLVKSTIGNQDPVSNAEYIVLFVVCPPRIEFQSLILRYYRMILLCLDSPTTPLAQRTLLAQTAILARKELWTVTIPPKRSLSFIGEGGIEVVNRWVRQDGHFYI